MTRSADAHAVIAVQRVPTNTNIGTMVPRRTDALAVASAICGFSALVPILSQVIGLILGAWSLRRIRRAYRLGVALPGTGWAVAGIVSSSLMLLGWLALFVGMAMLSSSFSQSTDSLSALLQPKSP